MKILSSVADRLNRRALEKSTAKATTITNKALREMRRMSWETDRSPSRLGRMGERASQLQSVVVPAAAAAVAIVGVISATVDLLDRLKKRQAEEVAPQ